MQKVEVFNLAQFREILKKAKESPKYNLDELVVESVQDILDTATCNSQKQIDTQSPESLEIKEQLRSCLRDFTIMCDNVLDVDEENPIYEDNSKRNYVKENIYSVQETCETINGWINKASTTTLRNAKLDDFENSGFSQ